MSIEMKPFGFTADGKAVHAYTMENASGVSVEVLDYGCTIRSLRVPSRDGAVDICLGYDTVAEYENYNAYIGAVIGRCTNRIRNASFEWKGGVCNLSANYPPDHVHGGFKGFDKHVWETVVASDRLIFTHYSPDGDEGYPGAVTVTVTYELKPDGALTMTYDAISDADTIINMTNHAYYNLNGQGSGNVLDHLMQSDSDTFTENDEHSLPSGRILSVDGTPMDFRTEKAIGRDFFADDEQLRRATGYDHNLIPRGEGMRHAATVRSEKTGIVMSVYTTQPGVHFYTANYLTERRGKGGAIYRAQDAFCLETQHFADAVHHPEFPSVVLKKGDKYHEVTEHRFSVR